MTVTVTVYSPATVKAVRVPAAAAAELSQKEDENILRDQNLHSAAAAGPGPDQARTWVGGRALGPGLSGPRDRVTSESGSARSWLAEDV